nr:DUF5518 domain-containing protein [Halopiger goleimassiliensis]
MSPLTSPGGTESLRQFRVAILLGIASIPLTVGINLAYTPDPVSATPLFAACIVSGYLYRPRPVIGIRAGVVTGLAGGVPILVRQGVAAVGDWWGNAILVDLVGDSWGMALSSAGAGVLTVAILTIVLVVVGSVGGLVGGWLNDRLGGRGALGTNA